MTQLTMAELRDALDAVWGELPVAEVRVLSERRPEVVLTARQNHEDIYHRDPEDVAEDDQQADSVVHWGQIAVIMRRMEALYNELQAAPPTAQFIYDQVLRALTKSFGLPR